MILLANSALAQPTTNPAGTVEPGDLIEVSMFELTGAGGEATFQLHVDADGKIAVPWVPPVAVSGKTTDVAASIVGDAYRSANLIERPQITIALVTKARNSQVPNGPMGVGDTLKVSVLDTTGPTPRWSHVNAVLAADGTVTMPVIGAVKIVGMTEGEATAVILKAYDDQNVGHHPMVVVLRTMAAGH
jgi:protein involved in polysaccharide export with SLBB domain